MSDADLFAPALVTLAARINAEHRACETAVKAGLEHAAEAGRLLIEAKGQCQHGDWGSWLTGNFEGSERTARLYMQVFRGLPELEGKRQRVADLSLGEAARLLADPARLAIGPAETPPVLDMPFDLCDGAWHIGSHHDDERLWIVPTASYPRWFHVALLYGPDENDELSFVRGTVNPIGWPSVRGFCRDQLHFNVDDAAWEHWQASTGCDHNFMLGESQDDVLEKSMLRARICADREERAARAEMHETPA